uniref:Uncharacterized protein n=1 Tax=Glossina pallidipes TaxID=7398 RepID=A0A1A9ZQL4_GLOPL
MQINIESEDEEPFLGQDLVENQVTGTVVVGGKGKPGGPSGKQRSEDHHKDLRACAEIVFTVLIMRPTMEKKKIKLNNCSAGISKFSGPLLAQDQTRPLALDPISN